MKRTKSNFFLKYNKRNKQGLAIAACFLPLLTPMHATADILVNGVSKGSTYNVAGDISGTTTPTIEVGGGDKLYNSTPGHTITGPAAAPAGSPYAVIENNGELDFDDITVTGGQRTDGDDSNGFDAIRAGTPYVGGFYTTLTDSSLNGGDAVDTSAADHRQEGGRALDSDEHVVTISNSTLTGGSTEASSDAAYAYGGDGLRTERGSLTLSDSEVHGGTANGVTDSDDSYTSGGTAIRIGEDTEFSISGTTGRGGDAYEAYFQRGGRGLNASGYGSVTSSYFYGGSAKESAPGLLGPEGRGGDGLFFLEPTGPVSITDVVATGGNSYSAIDVYGNLVTDARGGDGLDIQDLYNGPVSFYGTNIGRGGYGANEGGNGLEWDVFYDGIHIFGTVTGYGGGFSPYGNMEDGYGARLRDGELLFDLSHGGGQGKIISHGDVYLENVRLFLQDGAGGAPIMSGDTFTIVEIIGGSLLAEGLRNAANMELGEGDSVGLIGTTEFFISYEGGDGNDIVLTAFLVPEPSTYALLAGSLALCLSRKRRTA